MFGKMDAVLVDAPCSGLGVIGKKPEIKYRKTLEEIKELAGIQLKILRTCCKYVKPGGTLVYSTCTINPIENEQVVRAFLLNEEEFELCQLDLPFPPYVNQSRIKDGYIQLFPHLDQIDGFFICKLKRKVRN